MKNSFLNFYFNGIYETLQKNDKEDLESEFNQIGRDIGKRLALLTNFKVENDLNSLIYRIVFELLPSVYQADRRIERVEEEIEGAREEEAREEGKKELEEAREESREEAREEGKEEAKIKSRKEGKEEAKIKARDESINTNKLTYETDKFTELIEEPDWLKYNESSDSEKSLKIDRKEPIENINENLQRSKILVLIYENSHLFPSFSQSENEFCPSSIIAGIIEILLKIFDFNFEFVAYNGNNEQVIYAVKFKDLK